MDEIRGEYIELQIEMGRKNSYILYPVKIGVLGLGLLTILKIFPIITTIEENLHWSCRSIYTQNQSLR